MTAISGHSSGATRARSLARGPDASRAQRTGHVAARTQMGPSSTVEVTARKFSWMENLVHVDGRLMVANHVFFPDPYCVVQIDCRHLVDNIMVLESYRVGRRYATQILKVLESSRDLLAFHRF